MPDWFGEHPLGTVEVSELSASAPVAVTTTTVMTTAAEGEPASVLAVSAASRDNAAVATSGWAESNRGLLLGLLVVALLLVARELRSYRRHALA